MSSPSQDFGQNSYNKLGLFTFSVSMLASLAVLIYVSFLSGGIDLKEVPELKTNEKVPATNAPTNPEAPAAPEATPASGAWISTPEAVARGAELFAQNCVSCHGKDGLGNGPAAENLSPRPRNLVEGQWKYGGTRLGLMQVLAEGSPGTAMQSYSYLPLNDRWAIVHFIRSITKNQVADNDADVASQAAKLN
jgi:mono/diheme cytochrome c family protein